MRQSQSIFFPLQPQFSDQKIFAKRNTLYRRHPKTPLDKTICIEDKPVAPPIHDTYTSMKKKLEDYISKQKSKIGIHLNSEECNISNSKSKFIFRKKCRTKLKKSENSTIFIPSEEMNLPFTQHLLKSKNKLRSNHFHEAGNSYIQNKQHMDANLTNNAFRYKMQRSFDEGADIQNLPNKALQGKSQNSKSLQYIFKTRYRNRRQNSVNDKHGGIRVRSEALTIHSKTQVLVCNGFKSLETDDLERKKHQLMKINFELKMRKTVKFRLRQRTSQKGNQLGPWSKSHQIEEDEANFQVNLNPNKEIQ